MTTSFTYDALNRLTQKVTVDGGVSISAQQVYDAVGDLVARIDPNGNVTSYTYDGTHHLTKVEYPDGGVTTYAYDDAGRLVRKEDPNGSVFSLSWDKGCRNRGVRRAVSC